MSIILALCITDSLSCQLFLPTYLYRLSLSLVDNNYKLIIFWKCSSFLSLLFPFSGGDSCIAHNGNDRYFNLEQWLQHFEVQMARQSRRLPRVQRKWWPAVEFGDMLGLRLWGCWWLGGDDLRLGFLFGDFYIRRIFK